MARTADIKTSNGRRAEVEIYGLMGVCLLSVQQAEHMLAHAVESVLKDRTLIPENLMEQTS